ncbi:MAG: hypothetical protein HY541_03600, partial [Deltaproteobacteria bacterium]|nr:hypothetical protein [Deltaproteobacteria bacterium]
MMVLKWGLLLLFLALSPSGLAAASKIVNVDFVGLTKTSETLIRKKIVSIEGAMYSPAAVNKDIKTLYE